MKLLTKRFFVALILVVVLAVSVALVYILYVAEEPENEVLAFLEEVVSIDVAKYDVTAFDSSVTYPDWLAGLPQTTGKYALESETGKLDILFKFRNGTLSWCLVRNLEGQPQYIESPSADVHDVAVNFLQKYQTYSGDSDLETMKTMLNDVDVAANSTKTEGNLKLIVSITSFSSSFDWRYTINGTEYSRLCISFRDAQFYSFSADKSYY